MLRHFWHLKGRSFVSKRGGWVSQGWRAKGDDGWLMAGFGGGYPTSQARAKKNVRLTRPFVSTPMFTATERPITILTLVFFLGDSGRLFRGGGGGRGAGRLGAGGVVGLRHGRRAVQWWLPVAERNWVLVLQPGASLLLRIEMVQRNRVRRVHAVRESRQGKIEDKSERVESQGRSFFGMSW